MSVITERRVPDYWFTNKYGQKIPGFYLGK